MAVSRSERVPPSPRCPPMPRRSWGCLPQEWDRAPRVRPAPRRLAGCRVRPSPQEDRWPGRTPLPARPQHPRSSAPPLVGPGEPACSGLRPACPTRLRRDRFPALLQTCHPPVARASASVPGSFGSSISGSTSCGRGTAVPRNSALSMNARRILRVIGRRSSQQQATIDRPGGTAAIAPVPSSDLARQSVTRCR